MPSAQPRNNLSRRRADIRAAAGVSSGCILRQTRLLRRPQPILRSVIPTSRPTLTAGSTLCIETCPLSGVRMRPDTQDGVGTVRISIPVSRPCCGQLPDATLLGAGTAARVHWPCGARRQGRHGRDTVIGRFDLVRDTPHGYKMLEFNADTPDLRAGMFSDEWPGVLAHFGQYRTRMQATGARGWPTRFPERLPLTGLMSHRQSRRPNTARIAFASFGASREDRSTTEYLRGLARSPPPPLHADYVPIEELARERPGPVRRARANVLTFCIACILWSSSPWIATPQSGAAIGQMIFELVLQPTDWRSSILQARFCSRARRCRPYSGAWPSRARTSQDWECDLVRRLHAADFPGPGF